MKINLFEYYQRPIWFRPERAYTFCDFVSVDVFTGMSEIGVVNI